jgi:hypothetical protein
MSWQEVSGPDRAATSLASPSGYLDLVRLSVGFNRRLPRHARLAGTVPSMEGGNNGQLPAKTPQSDLPTEKSAGFIVKLDPDQTLSTIFIAIFACLNGWVGETPGPTVVRSFYRALGAWASPSHYR